MSIARAIARSLFGRSIEVLDLKIAFHKDANVYGTHGHLVASHRTQGLVNEQVRFVFIGLSDPPSLSPRVLEYVWEEARAQGYIPHRLESYGEVLATHVNLEPRAIVSVERRVAEDARHLHTVPSIASDGVDYSEVSRVLAKASVTGQMLASTANATPALESLAERGRFAHRTGGQTVKIGA